MGVFNRIFQALSDSRTKSVSSDSFLTGNWVDISGGQSKSGVVISKDNSITLSGVYAAVRVYTDAISSLPIHVIKETATSKVKDFNHPLTHLLSKEPNSLMTSFVWRQIIMPQILLWGNSFSLIEFEKGGGFRPKAIMPIHPQFIDKVEIENGVLMYYIILEDGKKFKVDQSQMLHFRGIGDNIMGKSVIDVAKDSLEGAKATEDFGSSFFKNGANLNGVLSTDAVLNDKSYENVKKSWDKAHGGVSKNNSTAILEQGLKYQSITIPPDSAQFLETRRFSIEDIARWFKLPPHMIGDLTHATFTNIDAQDLNLVKHSLLPLIINIEQEIDRKLFRENEKPSMYVKMNLEGLLRGDIKTRYEAHKIGIQNGFMTLNEARSLEGMNPIDGLDVTFMQLNTAPIVDGTNQPKVIDEKEKVKEEDPTQLT